MDNRDLILGEIQSAMSKLFGDSAAAVMRQAGRSCSSRLWPELPGGKSPEEALNIMSEALKALEGWGEFSVAGIEGDKVKIQFKNCYFPTFTEESGKPCGQQPICFFGFGLLEETFKRLTGIPVKVELDVRDDQTCTCHEILTMKGITPR